jgi:hypothetical protein
MSEGDTRKDEPPPDSGVLRSAADEPTAMWDEEALRREGFEALIRAPSSSNGSLPASVRSEGVEDPAKAHGQPPATTPPSPAPGKGLTWPVTITLAIAVAIVTFVVVRLLL